MTHVTVTDRNIVLAAVHPAGCPPLDLVATAAAVKAALDAAGVRYSVREYSATVSRAVSPLRRWKRSQRKGRI